MVYRISIVLAAILLGDSLKCNVSCLLLDILVLFLASLVRPYQSNARPIFNAIVIVVLGIFYLYKKEG
jgi:hypothetical protein